MALFGTAFAFLAGDLFAIGIVVVVVFLVVVVSIIVVVVFISGVGVGVSVDGVAADGVASDGFFVAAFAATLFPFLARFSPRPAFLFFLLGILLLLLSVQLVVFVAGSIACCNRMSRNLKIQKIPRNVEKLAIFCCF